MQVKTTSETNTKGMLPSAGERDAPDLDEHN